MLKLSNFRNYYIRTGTGYEVEWAVVDVRSGWFRRVTPRDICRLPGSFWQFAGTGEYTPGLQAERLYDLMRFHQRNPAG